MRKHIQEFCIARQSDKSILFVDTQKEQDDSSLIEKHVLDRYIETYDEESKGMTRNTVILSTKESGTFYTLIDDFGILYSVLTDKEFPIKLAQNMMQRIRRELNNMPDYHLQSKKSIETFARGFIVSILAEFSTDKCVNAAIEKQKIIDIEDLELHLQELNKFNSNSSAHPSNFSTADQKYINDSMRECIPAIQNIEMGKQGDQTMNKILDDSPESQNKQQSIDQQKQVNNQMLKNSMKARNLKIAIISALVILSILLYILVPLF